MNIVNDLHEQLAAICPIHGISIGDENDKGTWLIDFQPQATAPQRAAAIQLLAQFNIQSAQQQIQHSLAREQAAQAEARLATQLRTLTPQQAVDYIETTVTNLATAKQVLKIMARMLIAMRDKVFPDLPE